MTNCPPVQMIPTVGADLEQRYLLEDGTVHLTGVHALVRLVLDLRRMDQRAGRDTAAFISGYEGSPLGGFDLELARHQHLLDAYDVVFRPAVNEELAATSVQGTQLAATQPDKRVAGITGFWYGKSPGLDRAADAMRHNNLGGTHREGGAVAIVGDDPAAKSSTAPGSSEQLLADLGMPTLYPEDPQAVLDLGLHAVAMSRASGLWVALKIATNVADGSGRVLVGPDRIVPIASTVAVDGRPFRHEVTGKLLQPNLTALERSRNGTRLDIARQYAAANGINRIVAATIDDRVGIIAAGKTFRDVTHALRILGLDSVELAHRGIRLLHLGMIHPIEPGILAEFASGLHEIVVVEEKRSFIEAAVKDLLYGRVQAPTVTGKLDLDGMSLLPAEGELDPDRIAAALSVRLMAHGSHPTVEAWHAAQRSPRERAALPIAIRTPFFCSGCPHNLSTKTPPGSLVGAGIGCHGLVLGMQPAQVGNVSGLTQMGGEGAQWLGMTPFLAREHMLQNIGDGTFHHSGSLAIRAAIASGANITYKLLYNSAVAMTGGQQAVGQMTVPEITHALSAEGVGKMIITTEQPSDYRRVKLARGVQVWSRDRLVEAQSTLAAISGVTVLIHDQECATELRRKRKRGILAEPIDRVMINERVCEGCGDCGVKSNCLSVQPVQTEFGRKTQIDQSSCNKDYSCLDGDCPSFLTVRTAKSGRRKPAPPRVVSLTAAEIPPPRVVPLRDPHTTRILGIGGSGVVTLSQILSVGAANAGLQVASLDQTGLAQKGGAVVSDIKISRNVIDIASKSAQGETDLYLGADLLVAADPRNLLAADPRRTVAVVSTAEVSTGQMVTDTQQRFPSAVELENRIRASTRSEESVFLDARTLSNALFGDDQFANLLLAGAAFQLGALPLPADAIEEAIALNGVKVEHNVQAFRRGRQAVADPDAFAEATADLRTIPPEGRAPSPETTQLLRLIDAPAGSELARLVEIRVPDLIAYQNVRYARTYAEFVADVYCAEREQTEGSTAVSEAVARHLHKLMAYKDEYEVARLSIDPAAEALLEAQFGPGARASYRLHPPLLRTLGVKHKITLGPWFRPVFAGLVSLRGLRGTRLDPFGYAKVRRVERQLVEEYRKVITETMPRLDSGNVRLGIQIAALPDMIRGYEQVKLRNVESYREKLHELRRHLGMTPAG